jgi:hypothetical protein
MRIPMIIMIIHDLPGLRCCILTHLGCPFGIGIGVGIYI